MKKKKCSLDNDSMRELANGRAADIRSKKSSRMPGTFLM